MKLYLAAPWIDKDRMPALGVLFQTAGHTITHKWWDVDNLPEGPDTGYALGKQAEADFHGVKNCDVLVLFNTSKSEGKAVEQGIALALGKPIIAVGIRGDGTSKNVFHYLTNYTWVKDIDDAIEELKKYGSKR